MKTISCIIPAYNEEAAIGNILSVVVPLIGTSLHEVIVVDDGSDDGTKPIVKTFAGVQLIENSTNQGKSRAVCKGIQESSGSHIFLLDSDLFFLKKENIDDLIRPIASDTADMAISYRKNSWPLYPFTEIDYLSGERILPKKYIIPLITEMELVRGYGLEVFLNKNVIIEHKLRIAVVPWPNVENNFHVQKQGLLRGIFITASVWWHVLCTVSLFEIYRQNIIMSKLIARDDNQGKSYKRAL